MKLQFLGQVYTQFQRNISTMAAGRIGCYRGRKYDLRTSTLTNNTQAPDSQMSAIIYKYRGVSYVVERHKFPTKPKKTVIRC